MHNLVKKLQTGTGVRTLLIGGAGFIGAHLAPLLISTGRQLTVMGRKKLTQSELSKGVQYLAGDFADRKLIDKLLDFHDEVIHLAYASVPNTSFENPLADLLQNLPPTEELFAMVAARGRKLLLVSSGGTVYGQATKLPLREDHPTKPISPYGVTKLTLENYAHLYAATHGLKYVCVRPANAYGVGQRPFIGQGFVSTAMAYAMRGETIRIFGQSGTVRDYIYVSDLASGIVSALEKGNLSETYNIGSGQGHSNLEIIQVLRPLMEEIGLNMKVEHLPARAFDVEVNILDASKLTEDTGWRPVVEFGAGLRLTRDWIEHFLGINIQKILS
jgi:UDP-glucose 4-epimerase